MHLRRLARLRPAFAIAAALWPVALTSVGVAASGAPPAISQDPPIDRVHPAVGEGLQFMSAGKRVNAMLYLPAGAGPDPAVILLHGLPGNEQNLDLARAMQRAGWAVVTFHYRGSWGSGGTFTLAGGCDDVGALLKDISSPADCGNGKSIRTGSWSWATVMAASLQAAPRDVIRSWRRSD